MSEKNAREEAFVADNVGRDDPQKIVAVVRHLLAVHDFGFAVPARNVALSQMIDGCES